MSSGDAQPRREIILEATAQLIGREGLGALSHRAVAREAGVPLTAVSYYFGSKDALIEAAIERLAEKEVAMLRELASSFVLDRVTPEAAAKAVAEVLRRMLQDEREARIGYLEAALYAARQDPPNAAPAHLWRSQREAARAILREAGSPTADIDGGLILAAGQGLFLAALVGALDVEGEPTLESQIRRLFEAFDARPAPADSASADDPQAPSAQLPSR